jgi:hypothetical protein
VVVLSCVTCTPITTLCVACTKLAWHAQGNECVLHCTAMYTYNRHAFWTAYCDHNHSS